MKFKLQSLLACTVIPRYIVPHPLSMHWQPLLLTMVAGNPAPPPIGEPLQHPTRAVCGQSCDPQAQVGVIGGLIGGLLGAVSGGSNNFRGDTCEDRCPYCTPAPPPDQRNICNGCHPDSNPCPTGLVCRIEYNQVSATFFPSWACLHSFSTRAVSLRRLRRVSAVYTSINAANGM